MSEPRLCGRCTDVVERLEPAACGHDPQTLRGKAIGQYHCPGCGAMVLAGLPHPELCGPCNRKCHPRFDRGRP